MRSIIFLDTNTIWHRKFAEALAGQTDLVAINPRAGALPKVNATTTETMRVLDVVLPRGWATYTAMVGQRILARIVQKTAETLTDEPIIVLTSPAYAKLASLLKSRFKVVYYTADDYRSYTGWGGPSVVAKENALYQMASLSVFVSEALRKRAVLEAGINARQTLVSPNASETRFSDWNCERPLLLVDRDGPVVGILGGLSDRLNLDVLAQLVESKAVGTFLVAGPIASDVLRRYPVFGSSKMAVAGRVIHEDMHRYANAMDVAVIPYAKQPLNFHCSPMRLYDHLATGLPIFALEGCNQIDQSEYPALTVVPSQSFVETIETMILNGLGARLKAPKDCFWLSRAKRVVSTIERSIYDM
jgi:hypothetical protein